ncbi:hypothetical protein ACEQ8H_001320 [Pleosporales sp. CAS-2024a]
MLSSILVPSQPPAGLRRNTLTTTVSPPLPPRRNSLSTAPAAQTAKLQVRLSTLPDDTKPAAAAAMDSRYKRATSPRRFVHPARSSTGTFADPYFDYSSSAYPRPASPRSSGERIGASHHHLHHHHHHSATYYTPSTSTSITAATAYARPRRNTGDIMARPTAATTSRSPYTPHANLDRPSSPLARPHDKRAETTYMTQPARTSHKKIYSVDDASRSTQLVAERDTIEPVRHSKRDSWDRGYGGVTSGGRTYHGGTTPPARLTDLGDDGYSYTDPASMYRDTEPAWRRPRAGSLERSARPSSMIVDRPARTSTRDAGPPPSVRGFAKINNSVPRHHTRSSSIDRSREVPKYEPYPDAAPTRTSSTRHHAPAIHQEPARDHRRDTYHDPYDRRDIENRRHNTADHLPDAQVASRGFGIAPSNPALAHDHHVPDHHQPPPYAQEPVHARADSYDAPYHSSHRASTHMPDPRVSDSRLSDSRTARGRESAPPPAAYENYDKRPREREASSTSFVPAVAGAATGVAATLGAANYMKNREKEREERTSSEEREREKERERRRAHDERDRRDTLDDRRERRSDERERDRDRRPEERREVSAAPPPYPPRPEIDAKPPRERRYEDQDREKSSRKPGSSEGSGDERPRHYVDRDAERRREAAPKEAALDPDEEFRRRVQQEAERNSRSTRDRDNDDTDRDRRRRKDDREGSQSPPDERSSNQNDANLVQEPESFDKLQADQPSKSVTIVTPPKDPQPAVKGILRKPTEKFPEEPEPIREGVAPHKDALKGKDIPIGARWTRIDRRLVNPEALEEAKERFEERMDCVIVLRVLTKSEIQKLADRTRKIRERREDEYDDRERDEREKRGYHSSRDDQDEDDREYDREYDRSRDRDRERRSRRQNDDDASEYSDLDRERERPKMLEPAR